MNPANGNVAACHSDRFGVLVALLIGAQTTGTVATATLPAIAPHVAQAIGVSSHLVGYQISLIAAAMLVSLAFGGNLGRRFGACRVTQVALGFAAGGALLCASGELVLIGIGSVLMGLGYGTMTPAASHLLMRFTPVSRRNLVFSIKQTGVPLGGILAAAIQPAIAVHAGWVYTLLVVAVAALVIAIAMQSMRARWDDDRDVGVAPIANALDGIGAVWKHASLRQLSLAGAALVIVQISLTTFTVVMFVEELGYSLVAAGFILTVSQVGGVVGRIFWGWLADRIGSCLFALGLLCVLMGVSAVSCALFTSTTPIVWVYLSLFVLGATASGWNGAYLAEIARSSPAGAIAAATGASLFVVNIGKLAGPIVFAQAMLWFQSYRATFAALALPAAFALLCVYLAALYAREGERQALRRVKQADADLRGAP
jgi:MFS family permease